ncbi:hypothetical protein KIPB_012149, partial [Kipferlia bialata]|eukprot:g12149.t1
MGNLCFIVVYTPSILSPQERGVERPEEESEEEVIEQNVAEAPIEAGVEVLDMKALEAAKKAQKKKKKVKKRVGPIFTPYGEAVKALPAALQALMTDARRNDIGESRLLEHVAQFLFDHFEHSSGIPGHSDTHSSAGIEHPSAETVD